MLYNNWSDDDGKSGYDDGDRDQENDNGDTLPTFFGRQPRESYPKGKGKLPKHSNLVVTSNFLFWQGGMMMMMPPTNYVTLFRVGREHKCSFCKRESNLDKLSDLSRSVLVS